MNLFQFVFFFFNIHSLIATSLPEDKQGNIISSYNDSNYKEYQNMGRMIILLYLKGIILIK